MRNTSPEELTFESVPLISVSGQIHPWLVDEARGDAMLSLALLAREVALDEYVASRDESCLSRLVQAESIVSSLKTDMGINPLDLP